jgi:cystathionine beta-lyase family protein involved in aluminum resistance
MVYIQRSRGYSLRPSLFVEDIEKIARIAKKQAPGCIVMVDNCYGEFVQKDEPVSHGADLMAGSLIKNPGGGVAPTGGYIAGRKDLVEMCAYRLTTPGTGREIGATLGNSRELFMGAFHAPHVTGEALKTAVFASALFEGLGYDVTPRCSEPRADIIQAVLLKEERALVAFCQGMQRGAPVDSFVIPEPWDMPGYDSKVIMAAGAFTLGASIELSADAPLREPYAAWMQGALNYHSGKFGGLLAAQSMMDKGIIGKN